MKGWSYLDNARSRASILEWNDASRIVIMSDCHRGDQGWADSFARNQNVFFAALQHYLQRDYLYIEAGDGDELWENRSYDRIREAHSNVFWLLSQFANRQRLFRLYGNHDLEKRRMGWGARRKDPLGESLEGLLLKHRDRDCCILVVHGHQVDFFNRALWRLARLLVRYLWQPLETLGVNDPTSTAGNSHRREVMEERLRGWSASRNQILVAGHNHRPAFALPGEPPYFNDGSCVHPRCITALELEAGCISLVKWSVQVRDDGTLYIGKTLLEGPRALSDYALNSHPDSHRIGK